MTDMIPHLINTATLTFIVNGAPYTVGAGNPNFEKIKEMLLSGEANNNPSELIDLADIPTTLHKSSDGKLTIVGNTVSYNGEPLHNVWTDKLIKFMEAGLPFNPVLAALESLMRNPSMRARTRFPLFVEQNKLGFLSDGRVVGLKAVRNNYLDKHSGTVLNKPGVSLPPMDRRDIDDDPSTHCSQGYHVGSWSYVASFGRGDDRYLLCAFWPENVVAVPNDMSTKVRLTHYEILQELSMDAIDAFVRDNHTLVVTATDDDDSYDDDDAYYHGDEHIH